MIIVLIWYQYLIYINQVINKIGRFKIGLTNFIKQDKLFTNMMKTVQRSILVLLLVLTAVNLAGHFALPSSCCSATDNTTTSGDSDCLVCTLQVGVWLPQLFVANSNSYISNAITDNQLIALGHPFTFHHPPIA